MVHKFVCDQARDLALTVRIRVTEISIAGLVGFRFLLDSGLHHDVANADAEPPLAAARDVDDAAPLVTAACQ